MKNLPHPSNRHKRPYSHSREVATPDNTAPGDLVTQGGETFEVQHVYAERNVRRASLFMVKRWHGDGVWGQGYHISWRVYKRFGNKTLPVFPLKKGSK